MSDEKGVEKVVAKDDAWELLMNSDWTLSQPVDVQQVMRHFPFNRFYQEKDSLLPVRIYGVVRVGGLLRLRAYVMVSPILCHNIEDGFPPDDLERVDVWTDEQQRMIKVSPYEKMRALFTEPDGFAMLLPQ